MFIEYLGITFFVLVLAVAIVVAGGLAIGFDVVGYLHSIWKKKIAKIKKPSRKSAERKPAAKKPKRKYVRKQK